MPNIIVKNKTLPVWSTIILSISLFFFFQEKRSCKGNFLLSRLAGIKVVIITPRSDVSPQERRMDADKKTSRYVAKLRLL